MQKQITLNSGQSQRVVFNVSPASPGVYDLTLDSLHGSFEAMAGVLGWTEGIQVQAVTVYPEIVYIGEEVDIKVYAQYPEPLPLHVSINGYVTIDGLVLTGAWTITDRNPTLVLKYTPEAMGDFTIVAQDKSASLKVLSAAPGQYYNPFGGTRMPLCVDIVVPGVPAFSYYNYTHPGGDLVWSALPLYGSPKSVFSTRWNVIESRLAYGLPIAWSPSGSNVTQWVTYYISRYTTSLVVMATAYTSCQQYWDSKDELAVMMAGKSHSAPRIPDEWRLAYGTTCPTCGGTGIYDNGRRRTCPECWGSGKTFRIDLIRGIRDWVKPIKFGTNPPVYAGIKQFNYTIKCPYCNTVVELDHEQKKLALVELLFDHIEDRHPTHPLTSPAWF